MSHRHRRAPLRLLPILSCVAVLAACGADYGPPASLTSIDLYPTVSPDGQWLASGSTYSSIRLLTLPGGHERTVLHGHQGRVLALAVSPDSQWLASGSGDATIRLWALWDMAQILRDMSEILQVPLGHMGRTEYERMQRWVADTLLSPEQQAVARYVAAVLRYRLGD